MGNNSFQNIFVYQPTFNKLELQKDKWIWTAEFIKSKFLSLHGAFFTNLKRIVFEIRIQFNNTPLVVRQNNYATKIVNAYIASDLDKWPKTLLNNFTIKNGLYGVTNLVRNRDKSKYVYSGSRAVLVMTLLGMSQFLVLLIVPHLILIIARIIF